MITNHYYLERKGMQSINGRSPGSITCKVTCRKKVAIEEEYLKRLHSVKGRKATNLVRVNVSSILVLKLIANKCYEDIFYFLSLLPLPSGLLICLVLFVIKFLIVRLVEVVGRRYSPWNHPAFLLYRDQTLS